MQTEREFLESLYAKLADISDWLEVLAEVKERIDQLPKIGVGEVEDRLTPYQEVELKAMETRLRKEFGKCLRSHFLICHST